MLYPLRSLPWPKLLIARTFEENLNVIELIIGLMLLTGPVSFFLFQTLPCDVLMTGIFRHYSELRDQDDEPPMRLNLDVTILIR